jgi:hypothetical protein
MGFLRVFLIAFDRLDRALCGKQSVVRIAVPWQEIAASAKPSVSQARPLNERGTVPTPPSAKQKPIPSADHPWRRALLSGSGLRPTLNARPSGSQGSAPAGTREKRHNQSNSKTFEERTLLTR